MTSIEYISNLNFDYLETYSFQRGIEFEENEQQIKIEYEGLKSRKEHQNDLPAVEKERLSNLHQLLGFTQTLISKNGLFHPSSKRTNTFRGDNPTVKKLISLLQTEIREIPRMLCAPNYRDAIVFYDSLGKIVSVLNVCLSCYNMETESGQIDGDFETYDLLKRFFIHVGHEVENPTYFIMDEMNKLRDKYAKSKIEI
eukprot:gene41937-56792_t